MYIQVNLFKVIMKSKFTLRGEVGIILHGYHSDRCWRPGCVLVALYITQLNSRQDS